MTLYGAIEAGGTKFNCIIASGPQDILAEVRIPTTTPQHTVEHTVRFFQDEGARLGQPLAAIGIGSFGPVDIHPGSPTYGYITTTPKPGWQNADLGGEIQRRLSVPVAFDTDVNAAAIGEGLWGAGQGLSDFLYITIGTGIGGGLIANGRPLHGLVHPEVGHILLPHQENDPFSGSCPYHGCCFEGLAAGPAIKSRWGISAEQLPNDHPAWELEAQYIALALHDLICAYSPQRIILGGGVMQQMHLFDLIRGRTLSALNGYVQSPIILNQIDRYIVPPGLGTRSGVLGALAMAQQLNARPA